MASSLEPIKDKLDQYEKVFGESFPTFQFFGRKSEELGEIIENCIQQKKDVYEMNLLDDDVTY